MNEPNTSWPAGPPSLRPGDRVEGLTVAIGFGVGERVVVAIVSADRSVTVPLCRRGRRRTLMESSTETLLHDDDLR